MISSELLAYKFQEILGAQYKCVPFHLYLSDFTKPMEIGGGIEYTIDAQAFELDKGLIPCIVRCTEQQPNSAPYVTKSLTYEATFSVPLNGIKRDKNNVLLEAPEFDFFADFTRLFEAVRYKELTFKDDYNPDTNTYASTYKGRVTMTEPVMAGKEIDKQERLLWRISGNFEVYGEDVRTGADIAVKVKVNGTWRKFENMSSLSLNADRNGNINQETAQLSGNLIASTKANSIAFSVDDVGISELIQWLRDMSDKNDDDITTSAIKHEKRKVKTALFRSRTLRKVFWAVPSVTYTASSVADRGSFSVVLSDDGMEE